MPQYMADPLSRADLRRYAEQIRRSLKVENELKFPVIELFEAMPDAFESDGLTTEIVPERELPPNIHAEYRLENNCIYVRESVYDRAYAGCGRDRMTITHEISHFLLLKQQKVRLYRTSGKKVPAYQDPEWQAMCLAGEILVPERLIKGMNVKEIAQRCGVSLVAARYQLKKINGATAR